MKKFRMTYRETYKNEHGFTRERYKEMEVFGTSVQQIFEDFERCGYHVCFVDEM